MDYLLAENNRFCRLIGHWYGSPYRDRLYVPCEPAGSVEWRGEYEGPERRTCQLCGHTEPPREDG